MLADRGTRQPEVGGRFREAPMVDDLGERADRGELVHGGASFAGRAPRIVHDLWTFCPPRAGLSQAPRVSTLRSERDGSSTRRIAMIAIRPAEQRGRAKLGW